MSVFMMAVARSVVMATRHRGLYHLANLGAATPRES
jgi:hypothetical protein